MFSKLFIYNNSKKTQKYIKNIWSIQKKAVPLCAFSRFGLPSSATKGTDDVDYSACQRRRLSISPGRCNN